MTDRRYKNPLFFQVFHVNIWKTPGRLFNDISTAERLGDFLPLYNFYFYYK